MFTYCREGTCCTISPQRRSRTARVWQLPWTQTGLVLSWPCRFRVTLWQEEKAIVSIPLLWTSWRHSFGQSGIYEPFDQLNGLLMSYISIWTVLCGAWLSSIASFLTAPGFSGDIGCAHICQSLLHRCAYLKHLRCNTINILPTFRISLVILALREDLNFWSLLSPPAQFRLQYLAQWVC